MRKKKDTHSFDFRPLGLAIREAREKAGLSRNDLGDKVFYGERHIADIENIGKHPSFQLFHDLVTMFHISVDEYFYPQEKAEKSTIRRQIDVSLEELKIIQGTIDGIMKYKGTGWCAPRQVDSEKNISFSASWFYQLAVFLCCL